MPRPERDRDRDRDRDRGDKFQSFSRPKQKIGKPSSIGQWYVDFKDTESLRKLMSSNGKILSRRRTGANAYEQRALSAAIKRARHMALLPYVATMA
jgi:small subunit ribosomal protein S18